MPRSRKKTSALGRDRTFGIVPTLCLLSSLIVASPCGVRAQPHEDRRLSPSGPSTPTRQRAEGLFFEKQYRDAYALYRDLVSRHSDDPDFALQWATILFEMNDDMVESAALRAVPVSYTHLRAHET